MIETTRPELPAGLYWRGGVIWLKLYLRGGLVLRESTKTDRLAEARRVLDLRRGAMANGVKIEPRADRVTCGELFDDLVTEYRINERRSLDRLEDSLGHLRPVFAPIRAHHVTEADVRRYVGRRLAAVTAHRCPGPDHACPTVAPATINRELAALKRAYSLGVRGRRIRERPAITMLEERNVRQGFFEAAEFATVRALLPEHLAGAVTFMYLTGWRSKSEVLPLTWRQVDFGARTVRLEPETTKNREGRTFVMTAELRACLEAQRARVEAIQQASEQIIPWVFVHDDGRPIRGFRKSWATACRLAGVPGRIAHDLRRTAVRNLERAGVPRTVAMKMTGHKTESVYRRYDIVSERDLHEAAARLDRAAGHNFGHNGAVLALPLKAGAS